jgi:hypothetical protein
MRQHDSTGIKIKEGQGFFPALLKKLFCTLLFIEIFLPVSLSGQEGENTTVNAEKIAEEMIYRDDGVSVYRGVTLFTCKYREQNGVYKCTGQPVVKKVENISLDTGDDLKDSVTLVIIREPVAERNMAFLQKDYDRKQDSDQWMYFPALRKLKQIVAENPNSPKTGSVFGTEITYEDSQRLRLNDYTWSYIGKDTVDGKECYVIAAEPTKAYSPGTSYSKIIFRVDMESNIPLKREHYDKRGDLAKTFFSKDLDKRDNIWTSRAEICVNHKSGRMSLVRTDSLNINPGIDPDLFTLRALQDQSFREQVLAPVRKKAE